MEKLLHNLSLAIELGKKDKNSPYPPDKVGKDGAVELTLQAIKSGIDPQMILNNGLLPGMRRIGEKFAEGEAFIPDMLIAASVMNAALEHLKPYISKGQVKLKGTLVLGTVQGDLHDIGKNLVKMIFEGSGWQVIDLGTDVDSKQFVEAVNEHPGAIVGMSALLTTTMLNMETVVKDLRKNNPRTKIFIGGAPLSESFCKQIAADGYFPDPHSFASSLDSTIE